MSYFWTNKISLKVLVYLISLDHISARELREACTKACEWYGENCMDEGKSKQRTIIYTAIEG